MTLGWGELIVLFAIILLLLGARRLPDIGRSLGQAVREFQRALRGKSGDDDDDPRPPANPSENP
ncbi:MAG: twin-arginine translocase TatA/TatE family subunit [Candidatus Omnitrophica bacterium]|nr:twin-arginine translocase TatA/TatE family subunit [Candidatus Omnitrophota bacterium]